MTLTIKLILLNLLYPRMCTLTLNDINEKMSTEVARRIYKSTFYPVCQSPSLMQTRSCKNTQRDFQLNPPVILLISAPWANMKIPAGIKNVKSCIQIRAKMYFSCVKLSVFEFLCVYFLSPPPTPQNPTGPGRWGPVLSLVLLEVTTC